MTRSRQFLSRRSQVRDEWWLGMSAIIGYWMCGIWGTGMRTWVKAAVVTRIVCALALFMLGFSGHALADPTLDPFSVQYQLPDGSYSSLCEPGHEKGGVPHDGGHHCDICVMAAAHLFTPPAAPAAIPPVAALPEPLRLDASANLKRILSHHRQSRGPPLSA
jgi:hypothetical protein